MSGWEAPPAPPAYFVGRQELQQRLGEMLSLLPVALLYGLQGMGKTAIASTYVASWEGPVVYGAAGGSSLPTLVNDVRRQLAEGPVEELGSARADLADALRLLEAHRALWFVDDLHHLDEAHQNQLVHGASLRLRQARFIATSRRRLAAAPDAPDRLELFVEPLSSDSCRQLWSALDKLYGAVDGFEAACRASGGSPFVLRQSHAGGGLLTGSQDPISHTLELLTEEERRLCLALSQARTPLPESTLLAAAEGLLSSPREALRSLHRRLLLERDGAGYCSIHDLFAERLAEQAPPAQKAEAHAALAQAISQSSMPVVLRCREATHHLRESRDPAAAGAYLLSHARELVRAGAVSELLEGLNAVQREHRTAAMELVRGRCLLRTQEIALGYRVLEALVDAPQCSGGHWVAFAQAALLSGRLDRADEALDAALRSPRSDDETLRHARMMLANLRAIQGRTQEALEILATAEASTSRPTDLVKVAHLRAFCHWLTESYPEADAAIRQARQIQQTASGSGAAWRMYITFAVVYVNLGDMEMAESVLRQANAGLEETDESVPISLHVERGVLFAAQGELHKAAQLLASAQEHHRASGLQLLVWWAGIMLGRTLLLLGRVREGRATLEETRRSAEEAGAVSAVRAAQADAQLTPVQMLSDIHRWKDSRLPGIHHRVQLLQALQWSARGEGARAQAAVARWRDEVPALRQCGLDAVLCLLVEAVGARVEGDLKRGRELEDQAHAAARDARVDDDLIALIFEELGQQRTVDGAGSSRLTTSAQGTPPANALVLDGHLHELRSPRETLSLASRPVAQRLLYALARAPGCRVGNDQLAEALWEAEYNPLRHDKGIRVNISRLRSLIAAFQMSIQKDDAGYRLQVPADFLFLEPLG